MDLLPEITQPPTTKSTTRGKFFLYTLLILILVTIILWSRQPNVQATLTDWNKHTVWENIMRLVGSGDKELRGEKDGRINILLLGMGGVKHDGPYLTDSIMLISLNPATKDTAILSIPRDLSVNIPNLGWRKVNSANAYGEAKQPGTGAELASQVISSTFGIPIHYYIRVDFTGFVGLVDQLGGLKIKIDQPFTDNEYPGDNGEITTISFPAGEQLLSGQRVLEYVRSRHGTNGQGSDFSRAKRQQQIMLAFKDKLSKLSTFLNPNLLSKLYYTFKANIETNLETWEIIRFSDIFHNIETRQIYHRVLDASPTGGLTETRGDDGAYLLIPKNSNYETLKDIARDLTKVSAIRKEQPTIVIENGTKQAGLAEQTAQLLSNEGFQILSYGNAAKQETTITQLYKFGSTEKTESQKFLEKMIGYRTAQILGEQPSQTEDFLIILGQDMIN